MPHLDPLRRGLDAVLEASVVGSWTRCGFLVRRRLWCWDDLHPGELDGRTVVVTGGTSGIGRATAAACVRAGATVGIVGRDRHRAQQAAKELAGAAGGEVWAEHADLGRLTDVEDLADRIARRCHRLHGLVHAAGLLSRTRERSPDGTERTAAVHVVGPHLLTSRLTPLLEAGAPSAVVWVSSGGMYAQPLRVDRLDPPAAAGYRGTVAYARAKRAQVALAGRWAERLGPRGVTSHAMHPGWVDTAALHEGLPTFARAMRPLLRRAPEGADTVVWLLRTTPVAPARKGIWLDRRARPAHRWPVIADPVGEADRLWTWCQAQAGLTP